MKTALTASIALAITAFSPALAEGDKDASFSYNPNDSVSDIYIDLAETAATFCADSYENSAIPSAWGSAKVTCERDLLNQVIDQIDNQQLSNLHYNTPDARSDQFAELGDTN